jgi:glyoxylase-like metal-dependent hydrolase (beta-lactamase superfamily II)
MTRIHMTAILVAMTLAWTSSAPSLAKAGEASRPTVSFAIVKTGKSSAKEALVYSGGRWSRSVDNNFVAILIRHGDRELLFDTGLGAKVDSQYAQGMPWWARPSFKYDKPIDPARAQLARAGEPPIRQIILSHSHWDHASGVVDFPGAEVWVSPEELAVIRRPGSGLGEAWSSQVGDRSIAWRTLIFKPVAYHGFDRSLDLFGDGTAVLVPQYGHTPGSVGLFLTTSSGRRYFFCGDAVWSAAALKNARPKFWLANQLADANKGRTQAEVDRMARLAKREPDLTVVPAHDSVVQNRLGYFPAWIR